MLFDKLSRLQVGSQFSVGDRPAMLLLSKHQLFENLLMVYFRRNLERAYYLSFSRYYLGINPTFGPTDFLAYLLGNWKRQTLQRRTEKEMNQLNTSKRIEIPLNTKTVVTVTASSGTPIFVVL